LYNLGLGIFLQGRIFMEAGSPLSDRRALLMAKFEALLDECDQVADNAAYGETLDDLEEFFFIKGRKFLQETFQEKLQERIDRAEETQEGKQCPKCKKKHATKMTERKTSSPSMEALPLTAVTDTAATAKNTVFPSKQLLD
jgi:hypothetical protein